MKLIACLVTVIVFAATTPPTFAAGPYITFAGGVSVLKDTASENSYYNMYIDKENSQTGIGITTGTGYDFDGFRLEAEIGYRTANDSQYSKVRSNRTSIMGNGYYDIKTGTPFIPFAGVGIGIIAADEIYRSHYEYIDTVIGYQLTAGISYVLSTQTNLDVTYRLQGTAMNFENEKFYSEFSSLSNNFFVGARWKY